MERNRSSSKSWFRQFIESPLRDLAPTFRLDNTRNFKAVDLFRLPYNDYLLYLHLLDPSSDLHPPCGICPSSECTRENKIFWTIHSGSGCWSCPWNNKSTPSGEEFLFRVTMLILTTWNTFHFFSRGIIKELVSQITWKEPIGFFQGSFSSSSSTSSLFSSYRQHFQLGPTKQYSGAGLFILCFSSNYSEQQTWCF